DAHHHRGRPGQALAVRDQARARRARRTHRGAMSMADQIELFREHYRRDTIPEQYEGMRNLKANLALCALLVAGSLLAWGVPQASGAWGCMAGLLIFNFFEYAFHRWVSHRRRPGLRRSYQRHTGEH